MKADKATCNRKLTISKFKFDLFAELLSNETQIITKLTIDKSTYFSLELKIYPDTSDSNLK